MVPLIAHSSERRGDIASQLGTQHYSYRFVENRIIKLLSQAGYTTTYISDPQMFKHPKAYEGLLGVPPDDVVHIAFRSPENLRIMEGAKNVCDMAWEFEVMRDFGLLTDSILDNQVKMLSLMDEVWVGSTFSRDVLKSYGLKAYVIPKPIIGKTPPRRLNFPEALEALEAVATVPLLFSGGASREANAELVARVIAPFSEHETFQNRLRGEGGRVFLSVLNPGDMRKNLFNLIDGFQMAANTVANNDVLILKLIVENRGEYLLNGVYDSLRGAAHVGHRHYVPLSYSNPNIIVVMDYLDDWQMEALYSLADYYISATHAEGLNLPLLEAMSYKTVPVATRNTAMIDYITDDDAIVIPECCFKSPIPGMAGDVALRPFSLNVANRFDIGQAVTKAMTLSQQDWERLSENTCRMVADKYSAGLVLKRIQDRLTVLTGATETTLVKGHQVEASA